MKTYRSKEDWRKLKRMVKRNMKPSAFSISCVTGEPLYEQAQTRKMKTGSKERLADSIDEN